MISPRLIKYLRKLDVDYGLLNHSPAYTALEVAEIAHVQGRDLIKAVAVKIDNQLAVVVMPAHYQLQLEQLRHQVGAKHIAMAPEQEFNHHFDDCEAGAVPSFGSLFGAHTYTAIDMDPNEVVALNGGSHSALLLMPWGEYMNLEAPELLEGVAMPAEMTPPKMTYRRGRLRL